MKRQMKQIVGLSTFAAACMALGMGLSYRWVARAEEDRPVVVDARNMDRMPPIAEVAEKLNPAVVAITNTSFVKSQRRAPGPINPFGGDEFFDWFFGPQHPQQPQPRTPRGGDEDVQRLQAGGSGVIISPTGEILTNFHVVDGLRGGEVALEVKTANGRTYKATVLGKDKELDIALIKIDAAHLPFAALGDSDAAKVGEWVVAIGNPLGLEHTVTQGIISAKGRKLTGGLESFLQTDAAINRGNSGGPLLNLRGEVIGINTAINPEGQNLGFAVPVNMVKRILVDLRSGKPVSRGYLGITPQELDQDFQTSLGVKEGVVVGDVQRGKAADKGGVQRLDVITTVDGQKITSPDDLVSSISSRRAGDTVKMTIVRDGKTRELTVVLGDRKDMQPTSGGQEGEESAPPADETPDSKKINLEKTYGFTVEALTPANRHQFGVAEDRKGVVVTYVSPRSAAAEKGLTPGVVIVAVGTKETQSLADFNAQAKKYSGKPLLLVLRSPQGNGQITMAIPAR
jgi:serine protease Do